MNFARDIIEESKRRKGLYLIIAVMSVAAVLCVFLALKKTGIALTDNLIDSNGNITIPSAVQPKATGQAGNCIWKYYDYKGCQVIKFSGGAIPDYESSSDVPWAEYADEIDGVLIGNGVTRIGNNAFNGLPSLAAADFSQAAALESIGQYAFASSKDVSILKQIDLSACTNLTAIDDYAFKYCSLENGIILPDNCQIQSIGAYAFQYNKFTQFPFDKLSELVTLGNGAFNNCGVLTSVDLSSCTKLASIPDSCFDTCRALKSVTSSNELSIESIGKNAFSNCGLTAFAFDKCTKLKSIGEAAFFATSFTVVDLSNCTELESLNGFYNNRSLTTVILPDASVSKIKIVETSAFRQCSNLKDFDFSKLPNLERICQWGFVITGLTEVDLSGCPKLSVIETAAFQNCKSLTYVNLGDGGALSSISDAFRSNVNLKKIECGTLPYLTTFVSSAFNGCSSLEEFSFVELPALNTISSNSFINCKSLKHFNFKGCPNLKSIAGGAFSGCNSLEEFDYSGLEKLTSAASIYTGLKSVRRIDFSGCTALKDLYYFNNLRMNNMTSLEEVIYPPNWDGRVPDNCFESDINYPKDGVLNIDDKYVSIGKEAFKNCNISVINYTSTKINTAAWADGIFDNASGSDGTVINIGAEISIVPENAFASKLDVTEVHFAQNDNLTINANAFKSAGQPLAAMSNGDSYYVDDKGVVYSLDKTKLYYIPAGLTEYTVPDTVTEIMSDSCKMANDLQKLTFADISKIETLNSLAFANCETLNEISDGTTSASTVKAAKQLFANASIGSRAFYNTGLTDDDDDPTETAGTLTSESLKVITENDEGDKEYELTVTFEGEHTILDDAEGEERISNIDAVNGDVFYYPAGQTGNINVILSSPGASVKKYARIYLNLEDFADMNINRGMKVGDVITNVNDDGSTSQLTLKKAEGTDIYYFEVDINPGSTFAMQIPVYLKTVSSSSSTVNMWTEIVDSSDAPLKTALSDSDKYQSAEWYTALRRYGIEKTNADSAPSLVLRTEDGRKVLRFRSELTYKLQTTMADTLVDGKFGQDPVTYMKYSDVLTLPEGVSFEQEIADAVNSGDFKIVDNVVYVNTDSGQIKLMSFNTENTLRSIDISLDSEGKALTVKWTIKNDLLESENSSYEMSPPSVQISYNAPKIFRFTDSFDSENAEFVNDVTQNVKYYFAKLNQTSKYSDETIFTQTSEATTPLPEGAAVFTLDKSFKNLGEYGEASTNIYGGEGMNFYLDVENIGTKEGDANNIYDPLPEIYMIRPDDIEKMFSENKEFALEINRYLRDTSNAGRKTVTDMEGNEGSIGTINRGVGYASQNSSLYLVLDAEGNILVNTATFSSSLYVPDSTVLLCKVGAGDDCDYKTLKECFDGLGIAATYNTHYNCIWNNVNPLSLNAGEKKQLVIYAHAKDTFERLTQDRPNNYHSSTAVIDNYATMETASDKLTAYSDKIQWQMDYFIYKSYYNETADVSGKLVENGDILRYDLDIRHKGDSDYEDLPLYDSMNGRQALLIPVDENKDITNENGVKLSELDLEIVTDKDGRQYYILNKKGTYRNLKFATDEIGNLITADYVNVGTMSASSIPTAIKWYYPEISGTNNYPVSFKVISRDDLYNGTGYGSGYIYNKVFLNDRTYKRIDSEVSGNLGFWNADKNIVIRNAGQYDEKLESSRNSDIGPGESVTYKLTVSAHNKNGATTAFTTMYDVLPKTYGLFEWNKDNVHMRAVTSADTENETWKNWRISDTDPDGNTSEGQQYIYWNNSDDDTDKNGNIVLGSPETLDIYVTLDFPSDRTVWDAFFNKVDAERDKKLHNTLKVFTYDYEVTHGLKDIGKAYLQKGVYSTYLRNYSSAAGYKNLYDKHTFSDSTYQKNYIVYYITIYNSGSSRLYLTDIMDKLPEGFTYRGLCNTTDENSGSQVIHPKDYSSTGEVQTITDPTYLPADITDDNNSSDIVYKAATISSAQTDYGVRFSVSKGDKDTISYDDESGLCYLGYGEALVFGYSADIGTSKETLEKETNTVAMQYYDYLSTGLVQSEGVTANVNEDNSPDNDGTCSVVSNINASLSGFKGNYQSDWLMSDVSVRKGTISPGLEKHISEKEDDNGNTETVEGGIVKPEDTEKWEVKVSNTGTTAISNYTIVDTMQAPFYFTGDVGYTFHDKYGYTSENTLLYDLSITDKDGNEISQYLSRYNKEDINIAYQYSYSYRNTSNQLISVKVDVAAKLGEEKECQVYLSDFDKNISFKVTFDLDDNGNLKMTIVFPEDEMGIPPNCYWTLSVHTKLPKGLNVYSSFVNNAQLITTQEFDSDVISQGSPVYDSSNKAIGIKGTDIINVSSWLSTSAWKEIEECENPENKADSRLSNNYIVVKDKSKKFDYTLNIMKQFEDKPITRMVIIDNLPNAGDFFTYSPGTARNSEFMVSLDDLQSGSFVVTADGNQLSMNSGEELGYTLEFSTSVEFDKEDWNGTSAGTADWIAYSDAVEKINNNELKLEDIRSFRIIISGGSGIQTTEPITVKYTAQMTGDVPYAKVAWNNFGYRYDVSQESVVTSLSASSKEVGVLTAKIPKIQKKLVTDTEGDAPEEIMNNASAAFVIYKNAQIEYTDQQDLLEKLSDGNIDFTVVKLNSQQIRNQEFVELDALKKYQAVETDGEYSYEAVDEIWKWEQGESYTFTEIEIPDSTEFLSMQGKNSNSYTFNYDMDTLLKLTCENIFHDYNILITKTDDSAQKNPLKGAVIGEYKAFTADPDSDDYNQRIREIWQKYYSDYCSAVEMIKSRENSDYTLNVPSMAQLEGAESFEDFADIPDVIKTLQPGGEVDSDFAQFYIKENEDSTVTVYYYVGYGTTDENGTISYNGVSEDKFAFLEMISPKGYSLDLCLHTMDRTVNYGETQYVNIINKETPDLPVTGGNGIKGSILVGVSLMMISSLGIMLYQRRKGANRL
ncbi:MAG: leucine-rich repeat domain-containing protein [Oscillospiraceae bacterium]